MKRLSSYDNTLNKLNSQRFETFSNSLKYIPKLLLNYHLTFLLLFSAQFLLAQVSFPKTSLCQYQAKNRTNTN